MTMIHCRACGKPLDASAPNCPHCGAPQAVASANTMHSKGRITDYAQVPWFRRRWFVLLSLVFFSPVAAVLAATGELYYQGSDGTVKPMAGSIKNFKLSLYLFSGAVVFGLLVTQTTASHLIYAAITMLMALVWGLKK